MCSLLGLLCSFASVAAFHAPHPGLGRHRTMRCSAPMMASQDPIAVVCGPRSGLASAVTNALQSAGGWQVQAWDQRESAAPPACTRDAAAVILTADTGEIAGDGGPAVALPVRTLLSSTGARLERFVLVTANDMPTVVSNELPSLPFFRDKESAGDGGAVELEEACASRGFAAVMLRHGELFGGIPGNEPLPFRGGPMLEPVLDDDFTLRAALVTRMSTPAAVSEDAKLRSRRQTVAEAAAGAAAASPTVIAASRNQLTELSVYSAEGDAPTSAEWARMLERAMDSSEGVELMQVEFGTMDAPRFTSWLVTTWGPTTLRTISASMVRSGSRPVAARASDRGATIRWETLENGRIVPTGSLEFLIDTGSDLTSPSLRVLRLDGAGSPTSRSLVGEDEILRRLVEGLTVQYTKGVVTRGQSQDAGSVSDGAVASTMPPPPPLPPPPPPPPPPQSALLPQPSSEAADTPPSIPTTRTRAPRASGPRRKKRGNK